MRPQLNDTMMRVAEELSTRSTCQRRSVGCVIVSKEGHILATGYNGVPRNVVHCTVTPCPGALATKTLDVSAPNCHAVHAEANALIQCTRVLEIDRLFTTLSPCLECAKMILNTPCRQVFYRHRYEPTWRMTYQLLTTNGVKVSHRWQL